MHRKIIPGNGKTVVHATFDDGSKKVLTYFGPLNVEKIDEELVAINKERGAKGNKPPQDAEMVKLREANETIQAENQSLRKELEKLKKSDTSDKPAKKDK